MKTLVLGIGNILFGDEGIGVHLSNYISKKYSFNSKQNTVDILDGGTLALRLIPIISEYDKVLILDCLSADGGDSGDVYFFDFNDLPKDINWSGSAHEVEILQTLQMINIMEKLPEVKIVGVIAQNISQNTGFEISDKVLHASKVMEKIIIDHLDQLGTKPLIKDENTKLQDVACTSYRLNS